MAGKLKWDWTSGKWVGWAVRWAAVMPTVRACACNYGWLRVDGGLGVTGVTFPAGARVVGWGKAG